MLGGILLDFVIDAGFGEGFVERLALRVGEALVFARAADVDAGFDFRGEEVRARLMERWGTTVVLDNDAKLRTESYRSPHPPLAVAGGPPSPAVRERV